MRLVTVLRNLVAMGLVCAAAPTARAQSAPVGVAESAAAHASGSAEPSSEGVGGGDPLLAWVRALQMNDVEAGWALLPARDRAAMNLDEFRTFWGEERAALLEWALEWLAREPEQRTWVSSGGSLVPMRLVGGQWKIADPSPLHLPQTLPASVADLAKRWEDIGRLLGHGPFDRAESARQEAAWTGWAEQLRRSVPDVEPADGEWQWPATGQPAVLFRKEDGQWRCVRAPLAPTARALPTAPAAPTARSSGSRPQGESP